MSDVAAYHVLFPVQGGMWTGYSRGITVLLLVVLVLLH